MSTSRYFQSGKTTLPKQATLESIAVEAVVAATTVIEAMQPVADAVKNVTDTAEKIGRKAERIVAMMHAKDLGVVPTLPDINQCEDVDIEIAIKQHAEMMANLKKYMLQIKHIAEQTETVHAALSLTVAALKRQVQVVTEGEPLPKRGKRDKEGDDMHGLLAALPCP